MTQKTLFLTLLIGLFPYAYATDIYGPISSSEVNNALRLSGFNCESKISEGCEYEECLGNISGYSRPVLVLLPPSLTSLRVHFHGHKLNVFPEYDKNLKSMIKAFGIAADICKKGETAIFPESSGKCVDYDEQLKDETNLKSFFAGIHSATGNYVKSLPLHVSAHSGGGRTVGRLLSQGIKVDEVTIFDGIYSDKLKDQIKNWYKDGGGQLNLYSVRGQSPNNYVNNMIKELRLNLSEENETIKKTPYKKAVGEKIKILNRGSKANQSLKTHYEILSETWAN